MASTQRPAGRPRSKDVHDRVAAAASELFAENGYLGVTMDEIAVRANVSKKTLYRWWPHKAAVIAEVLVARADVRTVPDLGDTRAELLVVCDYIDDFTRSHDAFTRLCLTEAAADESAVLQSFLDIVAHRRDQARAAVQRGIARGDLPPDVDADALLDLWNGFFVYRRSFRPAPVHGNTVEQLVDLALAGQVPRLPAAGPATG
ncbi:TetR/AcrR family transcriptional regulator [Streptomyces ochraceiscleroticus]|uniref:TetR/AcrR family transcriptional regulator n=1 Tax=Streptomyces ochraceiscleroticus TaxID=47761 RepID=A0ABW1MIH2_9ACTN|nr:TetR/AcrR family transcriptional regulator [Streptomyces ochraceiscleroticus]